MNIDLIKDKIGIGPDKIYGVMGEFSEPEELVVAGRKIREMGYTKLDAMSPFPVHGIDDAIGVPPSKLGWRVIWCTLAGGLTAQLLIYTIPITFELCVLFSAFGAFIGMFAMNGLPKLYHPSFKHPSAYRASDDRFLLVIEAEDPKFDPQRSVEHLRSVGAGMVEVVEG